MIITPDKLNSLILENEKIRVIDIRSEEQIEELPINISDIIVSSVESLPVQIDRLNILICQFGVITEEIINSNNLENTYSLLGGALAWTNYKNAEKDLSRWSRQIAFPEIGIEGQKILSNSKVAVVGISNCHSFSSGCFSVTLFPKNSIEDTASTVPLGIYTGLNPSLVYLKQNILSSSI